jgi:hypothetical protein
VVKTKENTTVAIFPLFCATTFLPPRALAGNYLSNAINPGPDGTPAFTCAQNYLIDTSFSTMQTLLGCSTSKPSLYQGGPGYLYSNANSGSNSGGSSSGTGTNTAPTSADQAATSACNALSVLSGVSAGTIALLIVALVIALFGCCSLSCLWCRIRDPAITDPESSSPYSFRKRGSVGMLFPSFMYCCGCCASPAALLALENNTTGAVTNAATGAVTSPASGGSKHVPSIFSGGPTSFDSPKTVFYLAIAVEAALLAACILWGVGTMLTAWPSWNDFYSFTQAPQTIAPQLSTLQSSAKLQSGYWLCVAALVGCFPMAALSSWGLYLSMEQLQSKHYRRAMLAAFASSSYSSIGGGSDSNNASSASLGGSRATLATPSGKRIVAVPASGSSHNSSLSDLGAKEVEEEGQDDDDDKNDKQSKAGLLSKAGTSTPVLSFVNPAAGMASALMPKASNVTVEMSPHYSTSTGTGGAGTSSVGVAASSGLFDAYKKPRASKAAGK